MENYRITVTPKGPMATELISGTNWGHLAWAVRYLDGESSLQDWLSEQEREPWLISSQMPAGMLPRPLLAPTSENPISLSLKELELNKKVRKTLFIGEKTFLRIRDQLSEEILLDALKQEFAVGDSAAEGDVGFRPILMPHNRIDRLSGRTPEQGGLFFDDASAPSKETRLQLFIQSKSPCLEKLKCLFDHIGASGFGANASTGCGSMEFSIQEEKTLFAVNGNRAMSLSHGVLTNNMNASRYRQHVHFGKLGGHFAVGGFSPFKYPILMMRPGATFSPADNGPFGKLLRNVHHDEALKDIRHHALHLPIYFTEVT
jgi:CRISPR-associated protein Csm4